MDALQTCNASVVQQELDTAKVLRFQKNEITEHYIYASLAERVQGTHNRRILSQIAEDELRHYNVWKGYTKEDVGPSRMRVWFYTIVCRLLGLTFGIKLMERNENKAVGGYESLSRTFREANQIMHEEEEHEAALIGMIDEERLKYTGSVVLGLNDALVELMGVLAGLTFALQESRFVALSGIITGFAAALSMAASEYLSTKAEPGEGKNPFKASFYTGLAYLMTVVVLVAPFLLASSLYSALVIAFIGAVIIIGLFNYYVSVAQDVPFRSRFMEMVGLSFGVASLSFVAGLVVRAAFGIDV